MTAPSGAVEVARKRDPQAVEGVGTGAGRGGDPAPTEACPEAPAQAHPLDQWTHHDPAVRALIAEAAAKAWDEGHLQGGRDEYRGAGRWPMSTDLLAEEERTQLATSLRWHFNCHAAEPDQSYASLGIENAVLIVERIVAAHDAQVRADERQKVAALLADEGTVEKVASAICVEASGQPDHHGAWTDEARAAIGVITGLIGGEE